jgi:hypothetical protein
MPESAKIPPALPLLPLLLLSRINRNVIVKRHLRYWICMEIVELRESARWKGMHLENIDGLPLDDRSLPAESLPACLLLPQLGTKYRYAGHDQRLQTKLARERTEDVVVALER